MADWRVNLSSLVWGTCHLNHNAVSTMPELWLMTLLDNGRDFVEFCSGENAALSFTVTSSNILCSQRAKSHWCFDDWFHFRILTHHECGRKTGCWERRAQTQPGWRAWRSEQPPGAGAGHPPSWKTTTLICARAKQTHAKNGARRRFILPTGPQQVTHGHSRSFISPVVIVSNSLELLGHSKDRESDAKVRI